LFMTVDPNDRRPIYEQVADEIKASIARGELAPGAALPSVRRLAADLGVKTNTIAIAYRHLQSDGLITLKRGSGATVAFRAGEEELRKALKNSLTNLVLAGLPSRRIIELVIEELGDLKRI
jgi:GntR family transcriptional regulator